MNYKIDKFEKLIEALEGLPAIGRKSAIRLAYHMVLEDSFNALKIAHSIEEALQSLRRCEKCFNISEDEICKICDDEMREDTLCIVQSPKDIETIEQSGQYKGYYYVIDAMDSLDTTHLKQQARSCSEVIFAFSPSVANDSLILYIEDKLQDMKLSFSKIAQGVPTGVSLENIDMLSLGHALNSRTLV
ncbi:MAG: recombination mediator RecR [Campylobacterota bacterium]